MDLSRRRFATAAVILPAVGLSGCWFDDFFKTPFQTMQAYAKTIEGFIEHAKTLIDTIPAGSLTGNFKTAVDDFNSLYQSLDDALKAFIALPDNGASASGTAQQIFTLTYRALTAAEAVANLIPGGAIPAEVLSSVQVLLTFIGRFFGFTPPTAAAGATPQFARDASAAYAAAPNQAGAVASARVKQWVAQH